MKTLRIGVIILVIGVSLLIATVMRGKTIIATSSGQQQVSQGWPHLLEPRHTTIVLKEVSVDVVTIHVVHAKSWEATLNISLVTSIFTVEGMRKLYAATFKPAFRGLYYFIVTTPDGRLVDEVELRFEQAGLAQDLYVTSIVFIVVGTVAIAYNGLKLITKKNREN